MKQRPSPTPRRPHVRRRVLSVLVLLLSACTDDGETAAPRTPQPDADASLANAAQGSTPVIEESKVEANGFTFDVRSAGAQGAEPVILLHGFPQTSRSFTSQLKALAAAGYRAIAPDQRGYSPGARPSELSAYGALELMGDVIAIADELGLSRFHLVGHDWGAGIGWVTARFNTDRVASLSALSVPHPDALSRALDDPESCQTRASSYFATFMADSAEERFLADDAAFLRDLYTGLPQAEIDASVEFFREAGALTGALNWYRANFGSTRPVLGPVQVPVLYVWSDRDSSMCRDTAESTSDFVEGPYQFEVVAGVNHWLPELGAERVNELLLEQLRAHPIMPAEDR